MSFIDDNNRIVEEVLRHEHQQIARLLRFVDGRISSIDSPLLTKAVGLIDSLSRQEDEVSKRTAVVLSAILWTYRKPEWDGLKDFLLLVLSRLGFSPSTLMIDLECNKNNGRYSPLQSIIAQFSITLHQLQYEISVGNKNFLVTEFQRNVWNKIDKCSLLGISAPTSAGKSFILLLKSIDLLSKQAGNVVYIVPTLSLVSQVSLDFRHHLDLFGLNEYEILTTFYEHEEDDKKIFVLTQEKAIVAFSQTEAPFRNIRLLIVDEIQNVERVADDNEQRAKTLYDLLIEFRYNTNPDKTIISGPRIEGIGDLGLEIFGAESLEEETKGSPVVNLTYAINKVGSTYYLKQFSDIRKRPLSIPIKYSAPIDGHGKIQYRKKFHEYLMHVIHNLGPSSHNIVFSPTSNQARRTAIAIAENIQDSVPQLKSLIEYVSSTVHPKYDLCTTLMKGVAYHHGKTPAHVRRAIERAIKEQWIKNVVCTTTLMQGVNMPAQTVIIRNPYLYVHTKHGKPKLTNYEIANLRGRAGRLLKDFIGRTYVLDENSFEDMDDTDQTELFSEAKKQLHPGYGDKFIQYEDEVLSDLSNGIPPSSSNQEYAFLLTYIRQTALRYAQNGLERLHVSGIDISEERYAEISGELADLKVPKEVCFKNRYWDPLDLERLYNEILSLNIPTSVHENNTAKKLFKMVKHIANHFPIYADRYFRTEDDNVLFSECINAEKWSKEKPLKTILNTGYHDTSEKIERTIKLLQNKVSFGLPMLLKPIYDMKSQDSMFLRFIEMGAFRPFTRRMIELNVPRETAIFLSDTVFRGEDPNVDDVDKVIRGKLKGVYNRLDYWNQVQLESFA
jgi:hypothetical protein